MIRLLLLTLIVFACSSPEQTERNAETKRWFQSEGKLKVLSTVGMINDLVRQIGGDYIASLTLIKEEMDPHSYQLVKGDDEKLAAADLIFANGLGLEHGPSLHKYLNGNPKAILLGDLIRQENPNVILYFCGQPDPHIWMDVSLWMRTIPFIVNALSQKDPSHTGEYAANGKALEKKLVQFHEDLIKEIHTIPLEKRYLVTSHDAFHYFIRAYFAPEEEKMNGDWKKRYASPEGLCPESQISAKNVQDIIHYLSTYNVHVLFPESNVSKDSIAKIVDAGRRKGLTVKISNVTLYADSLGAKGSGTDSYIGMMKHDADAITQGSVFGTASSSDNK